MDTIGKRVAFARGLSGLSRRSLSETCGLSGGLVGLIESGDRTDLATSTMLALSDTLGAKLEWLARGIGAPPTEAEVLAAVNKRLSEAA